MFNLMIESLIKFLCQSQAANLAVQITEEVNLSYFPNWKGEIFKVITACSVHVIIKLLRQSAPLFHYTL